MQSYGNLPNWQIFLAAFIFFNKCTNLILSIMYHGQETIQGPNGPKAVQVPECMVCSYG